MYKSVWFIYIFRMIYDYLKDSNRKEELHLKPNLSTFCALSQNYQHNFEK